MQHNGLWGLLALAILAFLLVSLYKAPQQRPDLMHLEARFKNVGDLKEGASVMMSGLAIGTVTDVALSPELDVKVRIQLPANLEIPDDSDLRIETASLFSSSHLSLTLGGGFDVLEDGDEITYTQSSVDFLKLLQQIITAASTANTTVAE